MLCCHQEHSQLWRRWFSTLPLLATVPVIQQQIWDREFVTSLLMRGVLCTSMYLRYKKQSANEIFQPHTILLLLRCGHLGSNIPELLLKKQTCSVTPPFEENQIFFFSTDCISSQTKLSAITSPFCSINTNTPSCAMLLWDEQGGWIRGSLTLPTQSILGFRVTTQGSIQSCI